MPAKIGDTVRFLNDIGGGRVVRIKDNLAYVEDEDGFETPMPLRECVVIAPAASKPETAADIYSRPAQPRPAAESVPTPEIPVVEVDGGDSLNITIGFEASDLHKLSGASFDAWLVNDSNYYLYVVVSSRASKDTLWTTNYCGLAEPNMQEKIFTLTGADLARFDRMSVQYIAFKKDRAFEQRPASTAEMRIDTTKFAKLHCFRSNPYFDKPVIALDIVKDNRLTIQHTVDAPALAAALVSSAPSERETEKKDSSIHRKQQSISSKEADTPLEIDLHAYELTDSLNGLSNADILNMQIDRFCEVMDQNLRNIGRRIIFIHGKGEGILRQALMKELTHRYKGHDVQDASFREYGFGATQVTIRQTENTTAAHRNVSKRHKR